MLRHGVVIGGCRHAPASKGEGGPVGDGCDSLPLCLPLSGGADSYFLVCDQRTRPYTLVTYYSLCSTIEFILAFAFYVYIQIEDDEYKHIYQVSYESTNFLKQIWY
jgi:hypothetical protein